MFRNAYLRLKINRFVTSCIPSQNQRFHFVSIIQIIDISFIQKFH